jgi:hypothetical protein
MKNNILFLFFSIVVVISQQQQSSESTTSTSPSSTTNIQSTTTTQISSSSSTFKTPSSVIETFTTHDNSTSDDDDLEYFSPTCTVYLARELTDERRALFDRNKATPLCSELPSCVLYWVCPDELEDFLFQDRNGYWPFSDQFVFRLRREAFSQRFNASAYCTSLPGITCLGESNFRVTESKTVNCRRYEGYHYPSAILLSTFLGFCGVDRFYMNHPATAALKLLTLGGIGIW